MRTDFRLADSAEFPEAGLVVFSVGADEFCFEFAGDEGFEVFAGKAFVADDDLAGADQMFVMAEHRFAGLPAGHRGRVDQPGSLTPGGCVVCQFGDHR